MGEDRGGSEREGHLALGLEPSHHADLHVRVQGPQDGDAGQAERAGAVDQHAAGGRGRVPDDGVEGDREGIGEDRGLVRDAVRHGDQHGVVCRQLLGPRTGGRGDDADVDARAQVALCEAPAQAQIAGVARRAGWGDAARAAGQPRIEDDTLTDVEAAGLGPERDDLGHHLVAGHVGE